MYRLKEFIVCKVEEIKKNTPRHIIIKLLKTYNEKKIVKIAREKDKKEQR